MENSEAFVEPYGFGVWFEFKGKEYEYGIDFKEMVAYLSEKQFNNKLDEGISWYFGRCKLRKKLRVLG